jgi:maltose alpha-D-glucosyltransferase/alpha-amylase
VKAGKRNTCVVYGEKTFIKLFRRIDEGPHPEIELYKTFTRSGEPISARYFGALTYRGNDSVTYALGDCVEHFHHSRTLWHMAVDAVLHYMEAALAHGTVRRREEREIDETSDDILFERRIGVVGELTAHMHRTLAGSKDVPFKVESFSQLYQRSLYQSLRGLTHRVFSKVEAILNTLTDAHSMEMQSLILRKKEMLDIFMATLKAKLSAVRMSIHGDYHLGQIMTMDEQYRIADFEGLRMLPLSERRLKRSPFRDIATMVHSLFCVAHYTLFNNIHIQEKDRQKLLPLDQVWATKMGKVFVRSYLKAMEGSGLISASRDETISLIRIYLLERAIIELETAIDNNPDQITIASRCLFHYLGAMRLFTDEN